MTERFSQLAPLGIDDQRNIALMLIDFFSAMNNRQVCKDLGIELDGPRTIALSAWQFFQWARIKHGFDPLPFQAAVNEIVRKLENAGILDFAGFGPGVPPLGRTYYYKHEMTSRAAKGLLWLGRAFGAEYIGNQILRSLALIIGTTPSGVEAVGSGIQIAPNIVLTCGHVVEDMSVSSVTINGASAAVGECRADTKTDVGLIVLASTRPHELPDIALRSARILEEVVIAGFPPVPRGLAPVATVQRGEIVGRLGATMDGYPLELFSAIVRPGNSGGPLVSHDGRIVGIVTRSLERSRESADSMQPLPFFSAVPSEVIRDAFGRMGFKESLPWEDFQ